MINSKSDYHDYLDKDAKALGVKSSLKNWIFHDIWRFQRALRYLEYQLNCQRSFVLKKFMVALMRIRVRSLGRKLGFSIPPNVFGPGLSIAHAGTIVVNSNAKVGSHCRVHVCVNIGADISDGSQAPVLGDRCYIGPGAKVYGGIQLGDEVTIGANSVVNKCFNSHVTIAGAPAKVIANKGSSSYRDMS